ncbi:MAG: GldG family protein, partial [Gemmatimonadaceae bacterium]
FGLDPLLVGLPPTLSAIAARLGVLSHFQNIGRGVIDLRDVIYFLSLAAVFLALAYGAVLGRKLSRTGRARQRVRLGVALVAAIVIVVNLLGGYIHGRLDLTPDHAYTLSRGTKQIVGHLDDIVTIKEFASDALPTSVSLLKRDVDDLLRDVRSASHGKVRVLERNPSSDQTAASDARALGIQPVQFNVVGNASLQVKQGYLGLAIQYRGKSQTISFVNETDDLEYQLASDIRALTRATKPVIGVFNGATGQESATQALQRDLEKSYTVLPFTLSDTTQPRSTMRTIVLIGGPDSLPAAARARLTAFFNRGGSALVMTSGMLPDPRVPMAIPHPVGWNPMLARFGVSIPSNLVYDLAANEIIPMPSSMGQVLTRYPLFMHAQSTGASVVNQEVNNVLLPWASSIDTTAKQGYTITPLLVTSRGGGILTGETSIEPTRVFPQDDLASQLVAVQVAPASSRDSAVRGRVIVVGNTDFVTDRITSHAPANLDFALNAVDWLSQDDALISIRSKNRNPPALAFTSAATRDGVKYFNLIGVPLALIVVGLLALGSRRRRTRAPYQPLAAAAGGPA